MAPSYIFQIFLWVTVQNQICIAQWVIVDEIIQLRPLRHGHVQCILNPGAVNRDFSPIQEQQLHATGVLLNLQALSSYFMFVSFLPYGTFTVVTFITRFF